MNKIKKRSITLPSNRLSVSINFVGVLIFTLFVVFAGYGQSTRQVETIKVYKSKIEQLLLPTFTDTSHKQLSIAFLVSPYLEPEYSLCLKDSAGQTFLELRKLEKNLWSELMTRYAQKQGMDLTLKVSSYIVQVSKNFHKEMSESFTKITPQKFPHTPVNYDGASYEFRWHMNNEIKTTSFSHNLKANSYESALIKRLTQMALDIQKKSFKGMGYWK